MIISVGKWRWPLVALLPVVVVSVLAGTRVVRLIYEGKGVLEVAGSAKGAEADLALFRQSSTPFVKVESVPGQPKQISLQTEGRSPQEVAERLTTVGQACVSLAMAKRRDLLKKNRLSLEAQQKDYEARFAQLNAERVVILSGTKRPSPKANLVAKIEELKARRRQLIEHYPTHSDIPVLAKQIQDLVQQQGRRPVTISAKVVDLDRQITETNVRKDYFKRLAQKALEVEKGLKSEWRLQQPVTAPGRPHRVEGWPIAVGGLLAGLALGLGLFRGAQKQASVPMASGLWRPEPKEAAPSDEESPVALKVVSPEADHEAEKSQALAPETPESLPSDPLVEKAGALYSQWIDICRILYAPAPMAPQGVLDRIGPLLEQSSEFLEKGHDVLAKVLARSVMPGDLPAHVARTVLMTLTGAREAGVSPEHQLAMALAALFHDLAVVPRPAAQQDEVGSEVGRLSATVLRRIPDLQPEMLAMVEDILIGMDEYKLDTWQNGATNNTLEPLSKVLREIDRFEKLMQKQKSRLDRRVVNQ